MLLADAGPTIVVGWETGVAIATGLGGAVVAAARLLIGYLGKKDEVHQSQVSGLASTFLETSTKQHAECQKDKEVLVGVVQTFNKALTEVREELRGKKS